MNPNTHENASHAPGASPASPNGIYVPSHVQALTEFHDVAVAFPKSEVKDPWAEVRNQIAARGQSLGEMIRAAKPDYRARMILEFATMFGLLDEESLVRLRTAIRETN
jgi:hypothetical protein